MTDRELLEQALEALKVLAKYENPLTKIQVRKPRDGGPIVTMYPHQVATDAAELLRERLAQPEQEPHSLLCVCGAEWDIYPDGKEVLAATTPPRREWVGLTEEEVDECYYWKGRQWTTDELVRHVEAKLKEKNA